MCEQQLVGSWEELFHEFRSVFGGRIWIQYKYSLNWNVNLRPGVLPFYNNNVVANENESMGKVVV